MTTRTGNAAGLRASRYQAPDSIRAEVFRGLLDSPKSLPPKLFYDRAGARLFEAICELPEYYLTRTELGILRHRAEDIAARCGEHTALIEYGSGEGVKVRLLLDHLRHPAAYVPVDISMEQLTAVAAERARQYPHLRVAPVCADYTTRFALPSLPADARRVAFFPGSTIGNLHPAEATAFLHRIRATIGPRGALILGVDRRKDAGVLRGAYNDAAGVTAAFNLNLLTRLNRELDATFDLSSFRHWAHFNDDASRIEMHLESTMAQRVYIAGTPIDFERGETILTECSYKYDLSFLEDVVRPAGFRIEELWTDERDWFWVGFLEPTAG
jgi:dimethylhistidine N-methyltransferase